MAFELKKIVPWGRSFDEYKRMFSLTDSDLKVRFLSCGDGPASFNAELTQGGGKCVSFDPIYQFSTEEIRKRIDETFDKVLTQMRANEADYIWKEITSVDDLGNIRMNAMEKFLADFEKGKKENRYISGSLPNLDFEDHQFDLALSSHFLLLYSDHLDLSFHIQSITAMLRVAKEIRIFPTLDLKGRPSQHLTRLVEYFASKDHHIYQERVSYEFQIGGNQMLVIIK